jgi:hypothetical protein
MIAPNAHTKDIQRSFVQTAGTRLIANSQLAPCLADQRLGDCGMIGPQPIDGPTLEVFEGNEG